MNATYYYMNTYGATLGWQYTWGTANPLLLPPAPITGSRNGKPNSNAFIFEADWIPFGKEDFVGAAIRQSEDRSPVCRLYDVQWRHTQLRWLWAQCQRQQHGVPLRLDGILSIGWSISIASVTAKKPCKAS